MSLFARAVTGQAQIPDGNRADRLREVVTATFCHDAPNINGMHTARPRVPADLPLSLRDCEADGATHFMDIFRHKRTDNSRAALEACLHGFLGDIPPAAAASVLADAVGDLVASGRWSESDARNVIYTADRRIDRVVK